MSGMLVAKAAFFSFFAFGLLFPDAWWGTHSLAFLHPFLRYSILISGGIILIVSHFRPVSLSLVEKVRLPESKHVRWTIASLIAASMAALFHIFPIYHDFYGDAVRFVTAFGERTMSRPDVFIDHLFSFKFWHPRNGERSILGSALFMSYEFGLTHLQAFKLIGLVSGFAYVCLWLALVGKTIRDNLLQIILAVAGLTAPFLLLFMGHMEIYAPSIAAIIAYFLVLFRYFKTERRRYLWASALVLYFCLKFHSSAFLLVPSFAVTIIHRGMKSHPKFAQYFGWKKLTLFVLTPIFIVGAGMYFFYYQDFNDPRVFTPNFTIHERMFLPLLSPEPPYDRYNLLSTNHIFDYLNVMLLWSPLALFLLVILILVPRQIDWNHPTVMVSGMSLILYASLLFMVNPLLGMQFDWDLFSLPAPILLVFVVALFAQLKDVTFTSKLVGPSIAFTLWTVSIFPTNIMKEPLSYRLESLGIRTFKTYWIRAAAGIGFGIDLMRDDKALYLQRYLRGVDELRPYAVPGNDAEYAVLLHKVAFHYLRVEKNYTEALRYAQVSDSYSSNEHKNLICLIEANFLLKRFDDAYSWSQRLVGLNRNTQEALRIAIHCALEAERYGEAGRHADQYLKHWPKDPLIVEVSNRLKAETNLKDIRTLFAQGTN